jgi:hypothetical protein
MAALYLDGRDILGNCYDISVGVYGAKERRGCDSRGRGIGRE